MKKSPLKPETPKAVLINKPLIIGLSALVVFVVIYAVLSAFHQPKSAKSNQQVIAQGADYSVKAKDLSDLPGNYLDQKALRFFPKQPAKIPQSVLNQLDLLKNQQSFLQQRLAQLNTQRQTENQPINNMENQQARSSGLFFPGAAPAMNDDNNANKTANNTTTPNTSEGGTDSSKYGKQNMQTQKLHFLKPSDQAQQIYNLHSLTTPISPYEVQAGSLIPAVLLTAINTSLPGEVIAQVSHDVYDSVLGNFLLIPKGSKLIGQYDSQVSYGQRRVLIAFTRLIRPDGSSIVLDKYTGSDMAGSAGMKGNVDNHWMRVLGAATLSTLLSVGTALTADNMNDNNTYYRSSSQDAVLGAANGINQVGQQLTDKAINIQPTLTLPAGYQFNIIVNRDMILKPYHKR